MKYSYSRYEKKCRDIDAFANLSMIMFGVALGMVVLATIRRCDPMPAQAALIPMASHNTCTGCHTYSAHAKMTAYFRRNGSPVPEQMATAVLMTKRPRLLAAIATIETNGNPAKRNAGYKNRHSGSFQVNPYHWGRVSKDPIEQARQADSILDELTADYGHKAISVYGGDSTNKYQRTVLAELVSVPK